MLLTLISAALALELTAAEVARHDQAEDCWMILEGEVYDLTPWVAAHPGGEAILRGCGKDATWFFQHRDEAGGHSEAAQALLPSYRLGALGEEVAVEAVALPTPHPYALRLEGRRMGIGPTAGVGPKKSVALGVAHHFSTDGALAPSGFLTSFGYSLGFLDVLVTDVRAQGIGAVELKGRPLWQHGERGAPLSVALAGGGGYASVAGAPALYGQLVLERDLVDRRLSLRANGTGALSPGVDDSARASAGLGVELRPIPIHGLFVEAQLPFADPSAVAWSAGARIYTRSHHFALYVSSTPATSPWELAGPCPEQIAIGGSFEKAFRL
ncbi:MAG: cytochrome b5 domain-containing protein [Alphaproteobacteria bacterium]|nr:cytochrome b5 domain-containing protein [Alphaproteobacteria bacterium]MCB9792885.1 cytochrome b5 domain-containing protein [Alphaproteobacteria bacterium]MCB9797952.1 cytochrome b5 domain-containing protein [Alphaproteobacteria bacterium]